MSLFVYNELAVNAGRVVEYAKSIEKDRDHLREENDWLLKTIGELRSR